MANGTFGGGDGSPLTPFLVEDAQDVNAIRNNMSAHYKQVKAVDMSYYPRFTPIAGNFSGTYDGNGLDIKNLTISFSLTSTTKVGFFESLNGTIKNTHLKNCNISSSPDDYSGSTGGLVSVVGVNAIITSCSVSGFVTGGNYVGGFVGIISSSSASIRKCFSDCVVLARYSEGGGFVGSSSGGEIVDCYSSGSVKTTGSYTGGFSARNSYCVINRCYSACEVHGRDFSGGFVGSGNENIINSYSLAPFVSTASNYTNVGVFIGQGSVGAGCYNLSTTEYRVV